MRFSEQLKYLEEFKNGIITQLEQKKKTGTEKKNRKGICAERQQFLCPYTFLKVIKAI